MTDTHSHDIEEKVEDLLRSPLGCAFLAIISESDFPTSDAAAPEVSLQVAAKAVRAVHTYETRGLNAGNYLRSNNLRDLAIAMLDHQQSDWWFAALDRQKQAWIRFPKRNRALSPREFVPVSTDGRTSTASRRMGKPLGCGIYTSTLTQNVSSWQASLDNECHTQRDADFGKPPYSQWRLSAESSSRIYEINSPSDWHALTLKYRAKGLLRRNESISKVSRTYPLTLSTNNAPKDPSIDRRRQTFCTPDWVSVAKDFDAVHLTFGGLLTSQGVRMSSDGGWSLLRFWDTEQTIWLDWTFESCKQLPDYVPQEALLNLQVPAFLGDLEKADSTTAE